MKGNNTLELNNATVQEALQLWVDATFSSPAPRVKAVKSNQDYRHGLQVTLEVVEDSDDG